MTAVHFKAGLLVGDALTDAVDRFLQISFAWSEKAFAW